MEILFRIDDQDSFIEEATILEAISTSGYLMIPVGGQQAILLVTHEQGTCGLNDRSFSTVLPALMDCQLLAEGVICWHKDDTEPRHSCPSCMSVSYALYDTDIRLPSLCMYSAAV